MRKHIILFFLALLFLGACKQGNNTTDIIERNEMVRLLTDVHLVDGSLALQVNSDSLFKYGTGKYLYLFKQYHTDSATFKKSVRYYTSQPELFLPMYDEINKLLQAKSDSLSKVIAAEAAKNIKAQQKADKLKRDSIALKAKADKEKLKKDSINNKIKPKSKLQIPKTK